MKELLPYLALGLSALSCVIAAWNVLRAGNWRKTDEAQALFDRVGSTEKEQALQSQKLEALTTRLLELPTAAAVATLTAEVRALSQTVNTTERAVERIEAHLMEAAK